MNRREVLIKELFYFSSLLLAALIILEIIWPNIVLVYFNLNWLAVLVLVFGLASLVKK